MKYNFDKVVNRRGTDCVKWDHMYIMEPRTDENTLPLWVADMEFKVADEIVEALKSRAEHRIYGYTRPDKDYFEVVTNWYKKRFEWNINPDSICYAPGIVPAIGFIVNEFSNENDGVIIQPPVYYPFSSIINGSNRKVVNNELINNDGYYTINYDDLKEKASNPNNKIMVFCSPHNPVGRVWKKEEILEVAKICEETDTLLVVDEIHCDLIRKDQKHYPMMSLVDNTDNIICTVAPSKTFNMPGLQMSIIIIDNDNIKEKYMDYMNKRLGIGNYPSFGLSGAYAAYKYGEQWLDELNDYLDDNIRYANMFVKNNLPKAKFLAPEGTYLLWLNLSEYGDSKELMEKFLLDEKLFIEDGSIFGQMGEGYFRINIACPRVQLEECFNKIKNVVE